MTHHKIVMNLRSYTCKTITVPHTAIKTISPPPHTHTHTHTVVQELCESRGARPGLPVLTKIMVSVDVKPY